MELKIEQAKTHEKKQEQFLHIKMSIDDDIILHKFIQILQQVKGKVVKICFNSVCWVNYIEFHDALRMQIYIDEKYSSYYDIIVHNYAMFPRDHPSIVKKNLHNYEVHPNYVYIPISMLIDFHKETSLYLNMDKYVYPTDIIKFNCTLDVFNKNRIIQLLLKAINDTESLFYENRYKEYLFIHHDDFTYTRNNFIESLDKKTWEMFSAINFYGLDKPITYDANDYSRIQQQIKCELLYFDIDDVLENFESKKNIGFKNHEIFISRFIIYKKMSDYNKMRKILWSQFDFNYKPPDMFHVDFSPYGTNIIYNLWLIITYGLSQTTDSQAANDVSKNLCRPARCSEFAWHNFLLIGVYDPRLLCYIYQFCGIQLKK